MNKNIQKIFIALLTAIVGAAMGAVITVNASVFQFHSPPSFTGLYHGSVYNTTQNSRATISLLINQAQGQGNIGGTLDVQEPLRGSGSFTGTANANSIQFKVSSAQVPEPLLFLGNVQPDGSLAGTYCSVTEQNQCDVNAGKGTWSAAKP